MSDDNPIHPVVDPITSDELYRYLRRIVGELDERKIVREAKKLGHRIRQLCDAGDYDAARALVASIKDQKIGE
jgi:hypothetical protein